MQMQIKIMQMQLFFGPTTGKADKITQSQVSRLTDTIYNLDMLVMQ